MLPSFRTTKDKEIVLTFANPGAIYSVEEENSRKVYPTALHTV